MNPYRTARNQTLVALTAADQITHLVTEAALDSETGLPVDKPTLIAAIQAQQVIFNQQTALVLASINTGTK